MAKLHELLAVRKNLMGQAQKCRLDLQNTLTSKRHLFEQKLKTFVPLDEKGLPEVREQSDIQTTVRKETAWLASILAKALDASYAIDVANTKAFADVTLDDGTVLLKNVPGTALLELEKRVREVQDYVRIIPTLDPARGFESDRDREPGIYKAREVLKASTKKEQRPLVLAPATEKHAAQVQLITEDVRVGTIQELEWSALLTPALKAELMDRCESLFRAITKARSRANDHDIDTQTNRIGKTLLDYVFHPITS